MGDRIRILAINPGSTSTKIALFDDYDELFRETIWHSPEELRFFPEIQDQLDFRTATVEKTVEEKGFDISEVDVFSGRGGGLLSVSGGVYEVSGLLAHHASKGMSGQHPAQLGPQIALMFAERFGKRAFTVNPPDVDEFIDVARVSGIKGVHRESHIHALNQKEIALRFCKSRNLKYEDANLIICHIGGGTSVTAHRKGRMIDSNDIIKGSGPMSATRAGDLGYMYVIDLAYSGEYSKKELTDKLNKHGGIIDHFGSPDIRSVTDAMEKGDQSAKIVFDGMIYQNAKYAGSMAVALKGQVDAVILTGGVSNNKYFTGKMREYLSWIAEVVVMPGEFELEALAAGAVRAVRGEEETRVYSGVPVWRGFPQPSE